MDVQRYRKDHAWILRQFEALRELTHAGVRDHAADISRLLMTISGRIKLHLAAEEEFLYPSLAHSGDSAAAALGKRYEQEMQGMAATFVAFVKDWWTPAKLEHDPEGFQRSANTVLKALFERIKRENVELYPVVEKLHEHVSA